MFGVGPDGETLAVLFAVFEFADLGQTVTHYQSAGAWLLAVDPFTDVHVAFGLLEHAIAVVISIFDVTLLDWLVILLDFALS